MNFLRNHQILFSPVATACNQLKLIPTDYFGTNEKKNKNKSDWGLITLEH